MHGRKLITTYGPRECAGSVEMTSVFNPLSARSTPQLAAEVVLPAKNGTAKLDKRLQKKDIEGEMKCSNVT